MTDEWARPSSLRAGKEFFDYAIEHGLMDKVVMEGLGRGDIIHYVSHRHIPNT